MQTTAKAELAPCVDIGDFMWYNRPIEKNDSSAIAHNRLMNILALDRVERKTRSPFPNDYMTALLIRTGEMLRPISLLNKPADVGQVIKWRRNIPFTIGDKQ